MSIPRSPSMSSGFTLVELVIVLALFSLVLVFCYQALSISIVVQNRVSASIAEQTQRRATYSALYSALESGGAVTGDARVLTVDLSKASSRWLLAEDVQEVRFVLTESGELWQQLDGRLSGERLLDNGGGLQFSYLSVKGERTADWYAQANPYAVVLRGLSNTQERVDTAALAAPNPSEFAAEWLFLTP